MATSYLNRVKVASATTGQGSSITLGAAVSTAFFTPEEAGAEDGAQYSYIIVQGNDIEVQVEQTFFASGGAIARGTPVMSKISGTAGTAKIDLDGSQTIGFIASAEDLAAFASDLDISTYSEKTELADDDLFLVGDSEASPPFGLMKAKKSNLAPYIFKNLAADDIGQNTLNAQNWFPTAGGVAVEVGTYRFRGFLYLTRSAGTGSHTTDILFAGSATVSSMRALARCKTGDTTALAAESVVPITAANGANIKAASTSATEVIMVEVEGTVRFSGAGDFIPQFKYYTTLPGGAPTIKANSYFEMAPIGGEGVVSAGTWA